MKQSFKFYHQIDMMDCGPTCLRMIAKHYGLIVPLERVIELTETTRYGSKMENLALGAERMGFRTLGVKISIDRLKKEAPLPAIVHWNDNHYVVVYKIKGDTVYVADPAFGKLKYTTDEFISNWIGDGADRESSGLLLLLEPTPKLNESKNDQEVKKSGFAFLFQYLFAYKRFLMQLILGLFIGSVLQLMFPFLTQSIVDIGIQNHDLSFIYLILIAQIVIFLSSTFIEVIRGWILLHISTRINISLVSDFFIKLMNLPISFFDQKMTGDMLQRINDHRRIESFLTGSSISVLFSIFNIVIFGLVLLWYDLSIFAIYFTGTTLYCLWVILFLKRRKEIDYRQFDQKSEENSKIIELINGMQEIKLHNAERQKRWSWEHIQTKLFNIEVKNLKNQQLQILGSNAINEFKNILVTAFAAKLVIDGEITLGVMLAISYILGQLNGPVSEIISFINSVQDAKISLNRLSEIHNKDEEESNESSKITDIDKDAEITISDLNFRYVGVSENVLRNLSLVIPANKTTAIVGASGSGKTTLMKLLLKFYDPQNGNIQFGNYDLKDISQYAWRKKCGVVMQEGYIFNDSIANNIAIGHDKLDLQKLNKALEVANIREFIEKLPLGHKTKIGIEGIGLSTGQKQRILIARAVYKNPKIIYFDEATSALDAKNERVIMENLNAFFKDRTAVIIAHRLSTVKNADQIVVLHEGTIVEKGTHPELIKLKGYYYRLVKNQLDLEKLNDKE